MDPRLWSTVATYASLGILLEFLGARKDALRRVVLGEREKAFTELIDFVSLWVIVPFFAWDFYVIWVVFFLSGPPTIPNWSPTQILGGPIFRT